jgi:hypothetical protein
VRKPVAVLASFLLIAGSCAADDIHERELKHRLFSKATFVKTGVSAVWGHIRNSPHEWGRTAGGFAKRAASSYGHRAIKGVVEFSIASTWTHEDLRYERSDLPGTWPRLRYAVVHTFWVPRYRRGGDTFTTGRVTGAVVAGQVSRAWMPHRVATFGAGMASAGFSLGLDVGINVAREFWPRRR